MLAVQLHPQFLLKSVKILKRGLETGLCVDNYFSWIHDNIEGEKARGEFLNEKSSKQKLEIEKRKRRKWKVEGR